MDPQKLIDHQNVVAAVMSDHQPLNVHIDIMQTWLLISAIQLATRHPGLNTTTKTHLTQTGRAFQQAIVDYHPEAAELIEMGWHSEFDM